MQKMNYTLGRGELYFNMFKHGTQSGIGERYFGNTPEASFTSAVTNLDHYNSDRGTKEKDLSVALQTDRTGTFTCDHISPENIALFWLGSASALIQVGATGISETVSGVTQGLFYQLGISATNHSGASLVDNVIVTNDAATPVPYILDTDFSVNTELGRIEILNGGGITDNSNIIVTYDILDATREVMISGSQGVAGSLRYIANNPEGENIDYYWPFVKITPNGAFALKADQWQVIPFNVEILIRPGYEAVIATKRPVAA